MTDETASADAALLEWLDTTTPVTGSVTLFADMDAINRADAIVRKHAELAKDLEELGDEPAQRAIGEKSERTRIRSEMDRLTAEFEALDEKIEASKSVWTLRALRRDEKVDIGARHPMPAMPTPTQEQQETERGKARWDKIRTAWELKVRARTEAIVVDELVLAVVSVETPSGTVNGVSTEVLRQMMDAEYGRQRIELLSAEKNRLSEGRERPTLPF